MEYYSQQDESKSLNDSIKEISKEYCNKYFELLNYLIEEKKDGKTEFRMSFIGEQDIIIHPLNKDGKTFDFNIT